MCSLNNERTALSIIMNIIKNILEVILCIIFLIVFLVIQFLYYHPSVLFGIVMIIALFILLKDPKFLVLMFISVIIWIIYGICTIFMNLIEAIAK